MKLAVVVGGWHWPADPFIKLTAMATGADLFAIAHRSPELEVVRTEKLETLEYGQGVLGDIDRRLYARFPTIDELRARGWQYVEEPNTGGDWEFFNQWLDRHDHRDYDIILNCHDDTWIYRMDLFDQLSGDWWLLANGRYPEAPRGYVRGSFEFWKRELLDKIGGRIDTGRMTLTREGRSDTPKEFNALSRWNDACLPLRRWMTKQDVTHKVSYLSRHYRISAWVIEGERGFINSHVGASRSFEAGLKDHEL